MSENEKSLVIWAASGSTLYFTGVRDFGESAKEISFTYFGRETKVRRGACFGKRNMLGFALEISNE
jgi:hypothetical protein